MCPFDFSDEAAATDAELAADINRLKPLSDAELAALLPQRADQEQLAALIEAVNAATTKNQKRTVLVERLGKVSSAVKSVAEGLIKLA